MRLFARGGSHPPLPDPSGGPSQALRPVIGRGHVTEPRLRSAVRRACLSFAGEMRSGVVARRRWIMKTLRLAALRRPSSLERGRKQASASPRRKEQGRSRMPACGRNEMTHAHSSSARKRGLFDNRIGMQRMTILLCKLSQPRSSPYAGLAPPARAQAPAGTHAWLQNGCGKEWIPAFAGMNGGESRALSPSCADLVRASTTLARQIEKPKRGCPQSMRA